MTVMLFMISRKNKMASRIADLDDDNPHLVILIVVLEIKKIRWKVCISRRIYMLSKVQHGC